LLIKGGAQLQYVNLEVKEHVGIITISREKEMNALNTQVLTDLESALDSVKENADIYCVVVTGAGQKSFVAGADVFEMKDFNADEAKAFGAFGNRVFRKIEKLRVPVIAAVNGYALGGGLELALACDIRIASENAVFGFPEVGLGIIPGYGGTQRLPRIIGVSSAKKLMYTGMKIRADEALRLGIIEEVVSKEALMASVGKLAGLIAKQAPIAVSYLKQAVDQGLHDMDKALAIETDYFSMCFNTLDQKSAMDAFVNKHKLEGFENK